MWWRVLPCNKVTRVVLQLELELEQRCYASNMQE
jgi:hypothetical protein